MKDERYIKYDSPSGFAYIGFSKSPLQKVDEGYGFKGVVLQDEDRKKAQCHICGQWFNLLANHIVKHGVTRKEYRDKFGLNKTTALCSDSYSYKSEAVAFKAWEDENYKAAQLKKIHNWKKKKPDHIKTIEDENKFGTCDKQIKYILLRYLRKYKFYPGRGEKGDGGRIMNVLRTRHGSVNKALEYYGLPKRHRHGFNVELIAENGKQIFFHWNKDYDREKAYKFILDNGSFFQDPMVKEIISEENLLAKDNEPKPTSL